MICKTTQHTQSMPYSEYHPIRQMGKTNYSQQLMAYYLAANRDKRAMYATLNNWTNLQLFWWNFPHLIVVPMKDGLVLEFPCCEL